MKIKNKEIKTRDKLANVILGERMPWDIVNARTKEVILSAGKLITWTTVNQMVASGDDYVIKAGNARILLNRKETNEKIHSTS
jgi:hypothetical protein